MSSNYDSNFPKPPYLTQRPVHGQQGPPEYNSNYQNYSAGQGGGILDKVDQFHQKDHNRGDYESHDPLLSQVPTSRTYTSGGIDFEDSGSQRSYTSNMSRGPNQLPMNHNPSSYQDNSGSPRSYSSMPRGNGNQPPSNQPPSYQDSPRHRYKRSAEDYHYNYRGGYRPGFPEGDGYGTDGSGSAYTGTGSIGTGSARGYENYRYPENESLLPRNHSNHSMRPYQTNGTNSKAGSVCGSEKQPFLGGSVEPVRLTPSWENTNLPMEELNFKNVSTFDNFEQDLEPPADRHRLVFMTLVLHGVGTLMPWNMFITAQKYFVEYKLDSDDPTVKALAMNFLPYIGYASQLPNVVFNWLNIFVNLGGNLTTRIVWSILVEVVVFVFTVVLAMVDSSEWPGMFFWITIASVVLLNIANGIYQNTVYGMAARLPFKYTGAVVLGSNISGTFTAVINIIAIWLAPNMRTSAIYYFITALFVLLACFDTYFALPLNRFYRYYEVTHERAQKQAASTQGKARIPYWYIFKKAFPQLFNVFMVFFVTLAVFPGVLADICRTEESFIIGPKYFQAITCFLTFNVTAMLGNMLPALFTWPGPRFLCIPVLLRILLIPAFILCHYHPFGDVKRIMPVLIDSDWAYWVLVLVLGITSGYYSSLAMMYCPRSVEPEHAPIAGMFGAASLITGLFAGINFQLVWSWVVTNVTFDLPGYENTFRNGTCTDRIS